MLVLVRSGRRGIRFDAAATAGVAGFGAGGWIVRGLTSGGVTVGSGGLIGLIGLAGLSRVTIRGAGAGLAGAGDRAGANRFGAGLIAMTGLGSITGGTGFTSTAASSSVSSAGSNGKSAGSDSGLAVDSESLGGVIAGNSRTSNRCGVGS